MAARESSRYGLAMSDPYDDAPSKAAARSPAALFLENPLSKLPPCLATVSLLVAALAFTACCSSRNASEKIDGGISTSDGGAADGGALDGGASDRGASDGGAADGGALDGGASDGGAADGGAADGGAADGGALDGGALDGGAADGGGSWSATGSLVYSCAMPTATLLPTGEVLIAGGMGPDNQGEADAPLASAELYDPASGSWSATGSLATPRVAHTATLLPTGKVLVVGGEQAGVATEVASEELYDPVSGSWSATGSLATPRYQHTATLLPTGEVLVAGGSEALSFSPSLASAELYDPASGSWSATGSLTTARLGAAATLLATGKVLVSGGVATTGAPGTAGRCVASGELYDPASGSWSTTGSFVDAALCPSSTTLLATGQVLVAGGRDGIFGASLASAELYDPASGSWSVTGSLLTARDGQVAVLLPTGKVLIAGGEHQTGVDVPLASAELYDPASGIWSATGPLTPGTPDPFTTALPSTATLLCQPGASCPTGKVLVAGGETIFGGLSIVAELYSE